MFHDRGMSHQILHGHAYVTISFELILGTKHIIVFSTMNGMSFKIFSAKLPKMLLPIKPSLWFAKPFSEK